MAFNGYPASPVKKLAVDATTTKTYHGLTIQVGSTVIGRIKSWQPQPYGRETAHVYELNREAFGRPVDLVPGVATGFTIAFTRVEMWGQEIELAFGQTDIWEDLTDQTSPFVIDEYLHQGNSLYRHWQYQGCWFQDRNEGSAEAEGDGIYTVDATVAYIRRVAIPV